MAVEPMNIARAFLTAKRSAYGARASGTPMSAITHSFLAMTAPDQRDDRDQPARPTAPDQRSDRQGWQRGFANAWMVLGAAPSGLLLGYGIDRLAGTTPWWALGLSLLFLAVSLYQLVKDSSK
jgi:F0F1-type ATP synthase assembly protein I